MMRSRGGSSPCLCCVVSGCAKPCSAGMEWRRIPMHIIVTAKSNRNEETNTTCPITRLQTCTTCTLQACFAVCMFLGGALVCVCVCVCVFVLCVSSVCFSSVHMCMCLCVCALVKMFACAGVSTNILRGGLSKTSMEHRGGSVWGVKVCLRRGGRHTHPECNSCDG